MADGHNLRPRRVNRADFRHGDADPASRRGEPVELKNDAVRTIGQFRPNVQTIPATPLVPWDPTITREDLDRMSAEGGIPFEEVKARLGWK